MRNGIRISIVFLLLLLGLLGWWHKFKTSAPLATRETKPQAGMISPGTRAVPTLPAGPSTPPVYLDPSAPPDPEVTQRALASGEKGQMGLAIMQLANAQRIDFYGQIFDQNGQSVSDVKVEGSTLLVLGADHSGGNYYQTVSDGEGKFSFINAHGYGMGFKFDKPGYEYNYRQAPGWTSDYKPDPETPKIFTLWKLQGAEPMVHWELNRIGLAVDGTANSFDLLAGERSHGTGDIVVQFARTPQNIVRGKPFDWVLTLQIPTGGFAEITGPYPNEAPANGYLPTITITMPAGAKNWTASFDHSYYFTARNGKIFGRMSVHLVGDYVTPPTHFELEVYANPSSSRNLEFDPMKVVKP
jgi:hypothetical protein